MLNKLMAYCNRVGRFWHWVLQNFYESRSIMRASALTFTTLLALVPLTVVMFSILSIFPFFDHYNIAIQDFIFNNFVPSSGTVIEQYLQSFQDQASRLPIIGLAFLVVTALMMMITLEHTLNEVWKLRYRRRITGALLLYWSMLTLGPLLLGISLGVSSYLGSLSWFKGVSVEHFNHLLWVLPFFCEWIAFTFLYIVVPNCTVKFREAMLGGLVAAILFEVAKQVFGYYVIYFPTYKMLYGTLAVIPIFLLWVYFSWLIFLFGAQVVNGLRLDQAYRSIRRCPPFLLALRVLGLLAKAQKQGQVLSLKDIIDRDRHCSIVILYQVLAKLRALGLIYADRQERYVLSCDTHQITLHQLYRQIEWYLPESNTSEDNVEWHQDLSSILEGFHASNEKTLSTTLATLFRD